MKFTEPFYGVKAGEIYPTRFKIGDDCPPELVEAAKSVGAVGQTTKKAAKKAGKDGDSSD